MPIKQKCCQCLHYFSMLKLPRKLPSCVHSICQPCLRQIIDTRQEMILCGFCSSIVKKQQIRIFSLNTNLLMNLSQAHIAQNPPPQQEDNQLLNEPMLPSPLKEQQLLTEDLCPTHNVIMDVICISDKQKICPHCALFGDHRDHRFKRLDDFDKEIKEKRKVFTEIRKEKQFLWKSQGLKVHQLLKNGIQLKKAQLCQEIQNEYKRLLELLERAKHKAFLEIDNTCVQIQQNFNSIPSVSKLEKSKAKYEKWQKTCQQAITSIDKSQKVEDKLLLYYQGPLQIITQGYIYIDQFNKYSQQIFKKFNEKLSTIMVRQEPKDQKLFDKFFLFSKSGHTPNNSYLKSTDQDVSQINPFLDCTSSQILTGQSSILNNTSLEAEISNISRQIRGDQSRTSITPKKQHLKSVKSIEKDKPRNSAKLFNATSSPKITTFHKRPTSEVITYKFSPRNLKSPSAKQIIPQTETKPFDLKQPQKIYLQFSRNTLSDFFDISECNLPSDKVVQYVHRARRIHKIKALKLVNNRLNTTGFEKMTQFLQGVSNINLANNIINEGIFEVITKYKDRLQSLRVINLSHNPITLDKKSTARMQEVKRYGVIVIL